MKLLLTFFILLSTINLAYAEQSLPLEQIQTNNLVKAGNKSVTLIGKQIAVGDNAPNFKVVNENFTPITLADFKDHIILISVVPSLDTGVCSLQTKRFNKEVANFSNDVVMLTISNDLPFAQKRFCKVENIDKIKVLSDSVWRNFGLNYGLLIKDMGLLTRAIFIINKEGKVVYKELVANISNHPNYDNALNALKEITNKTSPTAQEVTETKEAKTPASTK